MRGALPGNCEVILALDGDEACKDSKHRRCCNKHYQQPEIELDCGPVVFSAHTLDDDLVDTGGGASHVGDGVAMVP